jgi:hypothetical protein
MAAPRPLLHLPIYAAACTGLYAGSLALVTMLQAEHNASVTRDEAPLLDAVSRAGVARRAAEDAVTSASGTLGKATGNYANATALSAQLDAAMANLAAKVANVTGVTTSLPATTRLPAAPGAVTHVAAPATAATTGASGKP